MIHITQIFIHNYLCDVCHNIITVFKKYLLYCYFYSVEFYSKVIADLIDRKQYAKNRYWYKASYTDGLINWLNARYPAVLVTRFVVDLIENIK